MNIHKILVFILALILSMPFSYADEVEESIVRMPDFPYKSPEALSFQRYGEYSVGEYSGNPQISIPLYTVSYKGLEVPISLTYQGGGIKVQDEATWVGLGWNLMPGGCINLIPAGKVDALQVSNGLLSSFDGLLNSNPAPFFLTDNNNYSINTAFYGDIRSFGERDFYSVNVSGKNLLFYIDPEDNTPTIIGSDKEKYKISALNMGWRIIDAEGYIYYFNSQEKAATTNGAIYTSAWYLDRMESPAGDVVEFSYTQEMPIFLQTKIFEQYDKILHSTVLHTFYWYENGIYKPETVSYANYPEGLSSALSLDGWTTQKRYLTSIYTNDQQVDFHLGGRDDIAGQSRRLDSITVKSTISNRTIRTIRLKYGYFESNNIGGDYLVEKGACTATTSYSSLRLKLDSVEIHGGHETPETYSFGYDETVGFPCKTSYATDLWGYYNGHENDAAITGVTHTFIPKATHCFLGSVADTAFYDRIMNLKGANRFSDSRYVGALSLTSITYPTRGYTKFTYEPHLFIANQIYPDANSDLVRGLNYQVQDINYQGGNGGPTIQQTITLGSDCKGMLEVTFLGGQKTLAQLHQVNTHIVLMRIDQPDHNPAYTVNLNGYPGNLSQNYSWTTSTPVYLPAGSYLFLASLPDAIGSTYGSSVKGTLSLSSIVNGTQPVVSTGGGIRIRSIENYDSNDNLLEKTDYEYVDTLGNTSGKLVRPETLSRIKNIYYFYNLDPRWTGWDESLNQILQLSSATSGMQPFPSLVAGNSIGYSRIVKKKYTDKGVRQEIKTFKNRELHWDLPELCAVCISDNGNLLTHEIIDEEGMLLKKTINNYVTSESNFKINAIIEPTTFGNQGLDPGNNRLGHKTFDIKCFSYKAFWSRLNQSTITEYSGGAASQVKTIDYSYNLTNKTLAQTEESTSISNLTIRKKMLYPNDFTDATALGMVGKNMIAVPVVQSKVLYNSSNSTETLQFAKKVTYTDNWGGSGYYRPWKEAFAFGSGNLEDRLTYRYNSDGSIIEIKKDAQPGVVYLWAYRGQYPVARIEGATYESVVSAFTQGKINSLYNKTTDIEPSLAELRNSLSSLGCMITTYTYEPLLGIASITEPNGTRTSYEYDGMGRLSGILDGNGNTISTHDYHYATLGAPDDYNCTQSTVMLDSLGTAGIISKSIYDDIGRPIQQISGGVTPGLFHNACQTYDMSGRVCRSWLPIATDGTDYIHPVDFASQSHGIYQDSYAFSATDYDALDRPLFVSTPGEAWATGNRGKRVTYTTNAASSVKKYIWQNSGLSESGYYAAGTLSCETTADEDSLTSQIYKDAQGRLILDRKVASSGNNLDTYYVYNNHGQPAIVLSPMYQEEADLSKYACQYTYDSRGRVREKTLPGCSYLKYGYNNADQLVYSQDGMMRQSGSKYRFHLYDAMGRMVIQGTCSSEPATLTSTVTTMKRTTSGNGYLSTGYTRSTLPTLSGATVEVVNYYDNYTFLPLYLPDLGSAIISKMTKSNPQSAKGLLTGTMQKASNGETLLDVFYYDNKGRIISTYSLALNKKLTAANYTYNFVGDVILDKKEYYSWSSAALSKILSVESTKSYYDNTRLLKRTVLKMTDSSSHVVRDTTRLEYDSLGHIASMNRYGIAADMNYQYDLVHGYLTGITSDGGFEQRLYRENNTGKKLYNGSISAMTWKIPGESYLRRYGYTYDGVNRLTEGAYSHLPVMSPYPGIINSNGGDPLTLEEGSSPLGLIPIIDNQDMIINPINAAGQYSERIAYDKNSNITCVERYGMNNLHQYGMIDSLVITRNGNQLKTIEDYAQKHLTYTGASDFYDGCTYSNEYSYNANGALDHDLNRDIDMILYDDLGNTRQIFYFDHEQIEYIYSADGTKLRAIYRPAASSALTDSTDYVGSLILKNGQPSMYMFDGGFVTFNSNGAIGSSRMHYYIQDYMGNNRMVVNRSGTTEQITHYYPYGGVIGDISTNENVQKYKFEGKELDRTFGLDNYDIHARQYFAMAPMWDRIDPLAEKYYGISPYAFCGGDPVNFGDYNGMDIFDIDENGVILLRQPTKKKYDELYSMSTGEHIKVTDQSILHGLHSPSHRIKLVNGNDKVWTSSSSLEIVSVFFFLADNTNIEWSMSLYESGTAALGAIYGDPEGITYGSAPAYYPEVDDASNEIAQIHSHINSDAPSGSYDENAANYMRKKNSDGSWASTTGNDQMIYEDKLRKRNNDYSIMPPHYLYLKNTNSVYQYDNYEGKKASFNKAGFNNIFFKKRR